jgi:hypothetical protein
MGIVICPKETRNPLYVKDLIIPPQNANHWDVIIMNEDQLLDYDPLNIENIFMFALVH